VALLGNACATSSELGRQEELAMLLTELAKRPLYTVEPSCTVMEAARQMLDHSVGALVITDAWDSTPLGIVTDRDLVMMIAEGLNPREATLASLACQELETVSIADDLHEVTEKMRKRGVRRLPILDIEKHLIGIVSVDDLLVHLGHEMSDIAAGIETELAYERSLAATRSRLRNSVK
jgi:signal-transduction protein with cAMP-binding, CBS, and nucleotidyltransferase domain